MSDPGNGEIHLSPLAGKRDAARRAHFVSALAVIGDALMRGDQRDRDAFHAFVVAHITLSFSSGQILDVVARCEDELDRIFESDAAALRGECRCDGCVSNLASCTASDVLDVGGEG